MIISRKDQSYTCSREQNDAMNYRILKHLIYLYPGKTSLMSSAELGNTGTMKILLEHGADVNSIDIYG